MYLKIYSIGGMNRDEFFPNFDNIRILRFSFNNFTDNNNMYSDETSGNSVTKLFNELVKLMRDGYAICFNNISPWTSALTANDEHIIVYNFKTLRVLGWCSLRYSRVNSSDGRYFCNGFINKLVTLSQYKGDNEIIKNQLTENFPANIGKLILLFIYNNINVPINLYTTERINNKLTDITISADIQYLYLYSLTSSISYYKNNIDFFHQISGKPKYIIYDESYLSTTTNNDTIFDDHVFYAFNKEYITDDRHGATLLQAHRALGDLHAFEINSIMRPETISMYNNFITPDYCYELQYFNFSDDMLKDNQNINIFIADGFILPDSDNKSDYTLRRSTSRRRRT